MADMGIYYTSIEIAPLDRPGARRLVDLVMVDTGSEYTWLPAELLADVGIVPVKSILFETADARILERPIGHALISAAGQTSPTIVTFAEPGDKVLLGAHALEGMRLRVDLVRRELVPSGPVIVAAAA